MNHARRKYYNNILLEDAQNMNSYWKTLKEIIGSSNYENYPPYFEGGRWSKMERRKII